MTQKKAPTAEGAKALLDKYSEKHPATAKSTRTFLDPGGIDSGLAATLKERTALQRDLIRVAHAHPEFRDDLLPLILDDGHLKEAKKKGKIPPAFLEHIKGKKDDAKEDDKKDEKDGDKDEKKDKGKGKKGLPPAFLANIKGKGKKATRHALIRYAHANPEHREALLPLIVADDPSFKSQLVRVAHANPELRDDLIPLVFGD